MFLGGRLSLVYSLSFLLQILKCMSYFPFVIKRKHLTDLRNYMTQLHGESAVLVGYETFLAYS